MGNLDYTTIDNPYNGNLKRASSGNDSIVSEKIAGAETTITSGSGAKASDAEINSPAQIGDEVISGQAMKDLWIESWIKSRNYKPKTSGFFIDGKKGYIEGMDIYISGSIVGGTIDIGGFDSTSFHVDAGGNMWLGASAYNISTNPFAVSSDGTIRATTGHIAGFTIDETSGLYAGAGATRVQMKAGAGIWAGATAIADAKFSVTNAGVIKATSGTIGGCVLSTTSIGSTNFVSGQLGSGWNISNTGTIEAQDVKIRGTIRSSVFEKDTISSVNGMVLVSSADVLDSDMTALDSSTLTISGETIFTENEVLRIKDGTDDEYMLVVGTGSAPTYTVTRDLAGSYSADSNPIWKKGTAVVSMGVGVGTKTGYILLDSSSANSPFIDVYGRNSNTYSDTTLHARLGWLKGITDSDLGLSTTDVWGLYADNAYIKGKLIVGTTGYVRGGQTDFQSSGDTGFFLGYSGGDYKFSIGEDVAGTNYLTWDGTYLRIKGNLDLTSIFNNVSYAVVDLPIPPTTEGFLSPSAYE